jgi:hypothetical protein
MADVARAVRQNYCIVDFPFHKIYIAMRIREEGIRVQQ